MNDKQSQEIVMDDKQSQEIVMDDKQSQELGRPGVCLVTGGAGFIGSHIVRALLEQGADVRILDNFSTGKRENVEELIRQFNGNQVEVVEGDLRDASRVKEAVHGVDVIFHEAAFVSVPQSMEEPQECFDVNITGTSLLLDADFDRQTRRHWRCGSRAASACGVAALDAGRSYRMGCRAGRGGETAARLRAS